MPSPRRTDVGYRDPHLTVTFPELGDDVHVVLRNPALHLRYAELTEPPDGTRVVLANLKRADELIAKLLVSWEMFDPDTGEMLPTLDQDPSVLTRVPDYVKTTILREVNQASDPTRLRKGTTPT